MKKLLGIVVLVFLENKWKKTLNGHVNTLGNVVHIIPYGV
jgi:hypothetical protein